MVQVKKRDVSPVLRKILEYDVAITKSFVLWANKLLPFRSLRIHYKMLEISCHGIPWLAFWLAFTWLFNNISLIQMQVNMLIGLFLDIILVAFIKAFTRRRRPIANTDDMLGQMGPDKFSFPSGHASRAVFVTYFFINLHPVHYMFIPPFLAWATTICMSRILLNRHHILDVLAGVVLGLMEGIFISIIWLEQSTALSVISYITDEKFEGAAYHV